MRTTPSLARRLDPVVRYADTQSVHRRSEMGGAPAVTPAPGVETNAPRTYPTSGL
jgi:hypothetical protein